MLEAIKKLQSMLLWSDRLGSDERAEIGEVLVILKKEKEKNV